MAEIEMTDAPAGRSQAATLRRFVYGAFSGCGAALPLVLALAAWFCVDGPDSRVPLLSQIEAADGPAAPVPNGADPAAWGGDHVGKAVPEFVTGDECLFCHRKDVGPAWLKNRHQLTMRPADPESAELRALWASESAKRVSNEVDLLLGDGRRTRFLKRGAAYGTVSLLSVACVPAPNLGKTPPQLIATENPTWHPRVFGRHCAGCHATGTDAKAHTFTTASLDCFACHGDATLEHSKDTSRMILSKARHDPPRVVISICGQCHLRTGKSRTTGTPYPNNFVGGDNLFRDFQVDLSDAALARLNPGDRHVAENVRDVVVKGQEKITCLSCHDVHGQSSKKHRRLNWKAICADCHAAAGSKQRPLTYEVHSTLCGY